MRDSRQMRLNINGVEWRKCDRCESWTDKLICNCFEEKMNKDLKKILSSNRKSYNHLIFISPYGRQTGMSGLGLDINKFALRGKNE